MSKFSFLLKIFLIGLVFFFVLTEGVEGIRVIMERKNWLRGNAEVTDILIKEIPYLRHKKYIDSWIVYKYAVNGIEYKNEEVLEKKEIFQKASTLSEIKAAKQRYYKIGSIHEVLIDPKGRSRPTIYTEETFKYIYQLFFGASCIFVLGYFILKDLKAMKYKA